MPDVVPVNRFIMQNDKRYLCTSISMSARFYIATYFALNRIFTYIWDLYMTSGLEIQPTHIHIDGSEHMEIPFFYFL